MRIGDLEWWHAHFRDDEIWSGPYATREDAEAGAAAVEHQFLISASRAFYSVADLIPETELMIERWCDDNPEMVAEDGSTPFDHLTEDQSSAFGAALIAAAGQWAAQEGLTDHPAASFARSSDPELAAWAKAEEA